MNQGTIIQERLEDGQMIFKGRFVTYDLYLPFKLIENNNRRDEKSPTHKILARGQHGHDFEAGIAWHGETKDHTPMITMLIDIPSMFDKEQEFVAFRRNDGVFEIVTSKPQEQPAQAA